jgi:Domain of unknown function (DUF4160)
MPEISRFFGIVIRMFYDDHSPPHFHATYGSSGVVISLPDLLVLEGRLPPRALGLVTEWATLHREDLLADWTLARSRSRLKSIAPLE